MPALKLEQFGGMLPAWGDRLLPTGQAALARDAYLFSGELIGWRQPKLLRTLTNSAARAAFRIPTTDDKTITGPSTWLEFVDQETSVVRSQVVDDTFERYYWASPSDVPRYNPKQRILDGNPAFMLGLNPPGCAPIVTPSGGGNSQTEGYPKPTLIGAANVAMAADRIYLVPFKPAGAEEINDVAFMPAADASTAKFRAVLYSDSSGAPHNLLAVGQEVQGIVANEQATSTFKYPYGVEKDTQYWLGIMGDTALSFVASDDQGAHTFAVEHTYTDGGLSVISSGGGTYTPQMWGDMTTSAQLENRGYVYTWLSAYGEESAPSPATSVDGWDNGSWEVDLYSPPANDLGQDRNITKVRVYRTIPSLSGDTTFFLVQEVDVGTASITDTATSDVIGLNNTMESLTWYPPPTDLKQIVTMPNGIIVGFKANELWFCEPYRPHAWPPSYVLTTEFPIVGLGVSGQAVIACTTSTPYVASGSSSNVMTLFKVPQPEPCISKGSILSRDDGVYYCSPYGLCRVSASGSITNTTENWVTREKWAQYTPAKYTHAVQLATFYVGFGVRVGTDNSLAQTGFSIELNSDSNSFTIWPQPGGHRLGFVQMTSPLGYDIDNFFTDPWSGIALMIMNDGIYYYDFADTNANFMPYVWRSKKYQQNVRENFQAMKVFFSVPPTTPGQGTRNVAATNDASWTTLATSQYGILRIYADDNLVTVREIYKSGELLRILSDFKYDTWQFEIEAQVQVSNVQVATSVKGLAQI